MALSSGTRLGPYKILSALGTGGMGEVYRARDSKLDRDVALKILPEAFAGDPERLARFEREAKTLAALNHPHIAHIHGVEESDGYARSCWSSWTDPRSRIGSRRDPSRLMKRRPSITLILNWKGTP